jgi:hypothetical protein
MPRKCSICVHDLRSEIERSVVAGDSYRTVAQRFGVSRDAAVRHRRHIMAAAPNSLQIEQIFQPGSLVEQLCGLTSEARHLKDKAEVAGDYRTALAAVRELCRIVELIARLRGELNERHEISMVNFQLDAETAKRIGETFLARHQLREPTP